MKKRTKRKCTAFLTACLMAFSAISPAVTVPAYAKNVEDIYGHKTHTQAQTGPMKFLNDIMQGLASFAYKDYKWPNSLTVGSTAFAIAEGIYEKRNTETKDPVFWSDSELTEQMENFYSTTDWTKFTGMYETVEISNTCEAVLTKEVSAYESLMDAAADKYGFSSYKEIFKAIAQTRYNDHKDLYQAAKKRGEIKGEETDKFDLFHIDGSWIDGKKGSKTPVGEDVAPTPTPTIVPTPTPTVNEDGTVLVPSPTPYPKNPKPADIDLLGKNSIAVSQSIDYAAQEFSDILADAVYPSPYNTDALISVVQGFEFGGNSTKIKNRYKKVGKEFPDTTGFISFTLFCDRQSAAGSTSETEERADIDYDKIIKRYAKIIANGKKRSKAAKYGTYRYSDQKFYQKVFENYKCTGSGGSLDMGKLPEEYKEILRKCMATWDSRVTKERREIIQQGIMLYGVKYSMGYARSNIDNPTYLDCSSFVGQSYWRAKVAGKDAAYWSTPTISNVFKKIDASQLIPGDIGQKHWPGLPYGADHVGIYLGTVNGTKYWMHCTSSGNGIKINNYTGFLNFGQYPKL